MKKDRQYILCGGTFFVLLLKARKQRTAARKKMEGIKDGLSDSDMLEGLIKVAFPNFRAPSGSSFKTYTSSYKACRLSTNEYFPFENEELISNFDRLVKTDYSEASARMTNFIKAFISEVDYGEWLVKALFDVIDCDPFITDELFYIERSAQPCDKKHLLAMDAVEFSPFLLGVWHFIVVNKRNNKVGAETIEAWHKKPEQNRAKHEFVSDIGRNWPRKIDVSLGTFIQEAGINNEIADSNEEVDNDRISVIGPGQKVAPEITTNPDDIIYISKTDFYGSKAEFSEYLSNARKKYDKMKTLLYNDSPRRFYDFYVCNNISQKIYIKNNLPQTKIISDATADTLKECSNFILISGTGGMGKSMMMRHLLLDSVKRYEDGGQLPLFIPLKDYSDSYDHLYDYIHKKFESLCADGDINRMEELLSEGRFLLLLDGLDEIKSDFKKKFEHDMEIFADKYTDNMFVISSRPTGSFISFNRFTVLDLCPFTKDQAKKLIEKVEFRLDEPKIKEQFMAELENKLFITHREFTENPLLLTIMLMTYEQFAEIPSKMHIFYREAYVALSQKHDASKGAFKRILKTELTADQFADYFAEFCARTYRDEKFEFTDTLFDKYFNALFEKEKGPSTVTASNFRYDLVDNMCLMYYESGKYHFTHRSFQEYFCALYFSKQKDKNLKAIGDLFEIKKSRVATDKAFSMLYDMIPDKMDEYVFEPYLEELFERCEEDEGYRTFLRTMYPVLYYDRGEAGEVSVNEPDSFLYHFLIQKEHIAGILDSDNFPDDDEFCIREWVYLDERYDDPDIDINSLVEMGEVSYEYKLEYGDPDVVGWNYAIDVDYIFSNPSKYKRLIKMLENEYFPLKEEYRRVAEYLERQRSKKNKLGDDLFDLFK